MSSIRTSRGKRTGQWVLLIAAVLVSCLPVLVLVVSSFKLESQIFTFKPVVLFRPHLSSFLYLFQKFPQFFHSLLNSAIVTLGGCAAVLLFSIPAAYSYSRLFSRRRARSAYYLIAVRMFPPIIILIPLYPALRAIGLLDTYVSLIIVYAAFQVSLSTMILKSFLDGVPRELDEQTYIDGCTRLQSFWYVTLPALAPGIISSAIFVAVFAWNDFDFAFLLTGRHTKTAAIMISEMQGMVQEGALNYGELFAAATIHVIPILVFVFAVQKWMVKGFTVGAVKG